jgi:cyclic pyranopterin phosphate synthase
LIKIYTDGAYNPVRRQGGWGVVQVENKKKRIYSGMVKNTTSNRMEITAAIEGIRRTPLSAEVVAITDSQYLFGCMTKSWQRRANRDLWEPLDELTAQRDVVWKWISRNTKNPFHQEAHNLATNLASENSKPELSKGETEGEELTHIDSSGRPCMVNVTEKLDTQRQAIAKGRVRMKVSTFELIKKGHTAKGDVLAVAQLAGIMAAKQTPNLIPLCHPLSIGNVSLDFSLDERNSAVEITSSVEGLGKTGMEMEAITAVAIAALTIYDMCKAVDHGIQIENIRLIMKTGGKGGTIKLE